MIKARSGARKSLRKSLSVVAHRRPPRPGRRCRLPAGRELSRFEREYLSGHFESPARAARCFWLCVVAEPSPTGLTRVLADFSSVLSTRPSPRVVGDDRDAALRVFLYPTPSEVAQ